MTDYVTQLKVNDLKATFQRISILESIDKHGHMSIEAIYDALIKKNPSLSLATVYKNIIVMVENSVLTEVPITGKKSKYELKKLDHIHLICTECGEVEDKSYNKSTERLFSHMTEEENFSLKKQQINLYGICACCKEAVAS